ncbi:hypothetical protein HRE53_13855 [Acaryochloris sp. 'Moss Beach']|uniref:hypothetical protein n=1 Tax=Acaryochloris sp. 'Moss Beach' TaxID=2740837 RepID=UPI001F27E8BD|nr:hypothetical protein [Acaryochloris sp. 'Moss Beach']UJB67761.1 hypothetical protein HRE53_13855 [Acaryochloris sp. 'Moss Beach']
MTQSPARVIAVAVPLLMYIRGLMFSVPVQFAAVSVRAIGLLYRSSVWNGINKCSLVK